ncbi:hypothetical protein AOLI_G00165910 [Acnodon oligacanthus]
MEAMSCKDMHVGPVWLGGGLVLLGFGSLITVSLNVAHYVGCVDFDVAFEMSFSVVQAVLILVQAIRREPHHDVHWDSIFSNRLAFRAQEEGRCSQISPTPPQQFLYHPGPPVPVLEEDVAEGDLCLPAALQHFQK